MFDFLQLGHNKWCASQWKLNSFVTMATYWIPDLPKIKMWRQTINMINKHKWNSENCPERDLNPRSLYFTGFNLRVYIRQTIACLVKDVLRYQTWEEPITYIRISTVHEQQFRPSWDSSAQCISYVGSVYRIFTFLFCLIRFLVDPILVAFIVCGPFPSRFLIY